MRKLKYAVDSSHSKQWTQRIGKIVVNFSAVEMECAHWLVQLSENEKLVSKALSMPFSKKAKSLIDYVERRSTSKRWRKESLRALNDAMKLSNVRNLVAHNPVMFYWAGPPETGEPDFVGVPNPRGIKLPNKESILSKKAADQAIDEMVSLVRRLETLRREWCEIRDAGQAPPVPKERKRLLITGKLKSIFEALVRSRGA